MTTTAARRAPVLPLLALGVSLARRGVLSVVSIAICALTVVIACAVALALAKRGGDAPIHTVPVVASAALAWGGGFLLAFAAAAHALRRDREGGVQHLLVARTASLRAYLVARIGGLAVLLALVVAGGTLVTGVVAVLGATRLSGVPKTLHATSAALAFALAFSAVLAPLSFATLGARSRAGGYFSMLLIVLVPEVIAGLLSGSVPESITEVIAIPSALAALRTALSPGTTDVLRFLRACLAIALWTAFASALVKRAAASLDRGDER